MAEDEKPKEETPEPQEEKPTEVIPEEKPKEENIDFDKELERLENTKPPEEQKYSEEEKALFNAQRAIQKAKELGVDVSTLIERDEAGGASEADVTKIVALQLADRDAKQLAQSDSEYKVIMWYVKNKGLTVEQAHILANPTRIKNLSSEIQRSKITPPAPDTTGQRTPTPVKTSLSKEQETELSRQGLAKQADGSFQGKYIKVVNEGGQLVQYKRKAGTKDEWERI